MENNTIPDLHFHEIVLIVDTNIECVIKGSPDNIHLIPVYAKDDIGSGDGANLSVTVKELYKMVRPLYKWGTYQYEDEVYCPIIKRY